MADFPERFLAGRLVALFFGSSKSSPVISPTAAAPEPPIVIRERAVMQTPGGLIATTPLTGLASGSYLMVTSSGTITAMTSGGSIIWNRPALDFSDRTGRPFSSLAVIPKIPIEMDPRDPFHQGGAHPFVVGDLTGDGVDDVAAAHYFFPNFAITGNGGTMVSVLDGTSGAFIWSRMYPGYVNEVLISGRRLVVASETGDLGGRGIPFLGENGTVSTLDTWEFQGPPDNIQVQLAWSFSTGAQWARWLALETIPGGQIAAAWTIAPVGTEGNHGNLFVASASNGVVAWSSATSGYPRFLRWDASRQRLVVLEEADPIGTFSYSILARNISDGSVGATMSASNAIALSFQVGDLDGDGSAEWVVGDIIAVSEGAIAVAGRVLAVDGDRGLQKWLQARPADPEADAFGVKAPHPYGLLLLPGEAGADVVVASLMPGMRDTELELLNGADGIVLASRRENNLLHPRFLSLYQSNGQWLLRAATSRQQV